MHDPSKWLDLGYDGGDTVELPVSRRMARSQNQGDEGDTAVLAALRPTPEPPEPTTSALTAIAWPLSDPQRGITRRLVSRFQRASRPDADPPDATIHRRAMTAPQAALTVRRLEPLHFCYQCGAVVPPWCEACFHHDWRHGRGIPPPTHLISVEADAMCETLVVRRIRRRAA